MKKYYMKMENSLKRSLKPEAIFRIFVKKMLKSARKKMKIVVFFIKKV